MIRILHSVSNMDRAGVETMLMNYYRHIDRNKIQFDFLCNKSKPGAYDEEIKKLGGRIYHTPGLNPFKYFKYLKFMKKFFAEHPEYKIVHAHNGAFIVYPLFAAKRNKIPVRISHVHSASFTFDYKWPLKVFCKPWIKSCATHKWACGRDAAKFYYGKKAVENGETLTINNAIDIDRFLFNKDKRDEIRNKYNLNGKYVIGHVGRFDKQKNHSFLIDIFSEVSKKDKNSVLLLLGEGSLMDEIANKVKNLGLEEKVIFMGNVDNVNEFYQAMDVFVLPSIWEGLPVVGIEAQAADLPCVFSDDVTVETTILPTTCYLSRKDSIEEWAKTVLKLKHHKRVDKSVEIKSAGYDIETESKKLVDIYTKLLGLNKEVKNEA